jgi:hypothetical protein
LSLGFNVSGEIKLGGRSSQLKGSPTTTVRQHVIRALYDGTGLKKIDRIVLVDTAGNERDSTTSLQYNRYINKLTITCSITATASYTIAKVRAYAGADLYFETVPDQQPPVSAGYKVDVTLEIVVNMSGSVAYDSASRPLTPVYIHVLIASILGGERTASAINIVRVEFWVGGARASFTPAKSLSADGLSLTISGSTSDHPGGTVTEIVILGSADVLWRYENINKDVVLGTPLNYTETTSA